MNILLLYLFCCNLKTSPLQQPALYYVCHIDGTVYYHDSNKKVKLGDTIRENYLLRYTMAGARLVVVGAKGMFEIKNLKPLPGQPLNKVLLIVRDHILPATKISQMYTRGNNPIINLQDMQNYLASLTDAPVPRLLMLDDIRFNLHPASFTERNKNYFFISYRYKDKSITHKLSYREPTRPNAPLYLLIDKNIFINENKPVDTSDIHDMQLQYQFSDDPAPALISNFAVTFVNRSVLLQELKIIVQYLGDSYTARFEKKEGLHRLVYEYLLNQYGWFDMDRIDELFPELELYK